MNINTANRTALITFMDTMLAEKGLDETIVYENALFGVSLEVGHMMKALYDESETTDLRKVALTMSKIDFLNADMMDFMRHVYRGAAMEGWLAPFGIHAA
jgi:hypothetical protein